MHRTVVNVQTGEVAEVPLTDEEIEQAKQQYDAWLAEQPQEADE
jgi:hypothetical protein